MNRCQIARRRIVSCIIITIVAVAVAIFLERRKDDTPRGNRNVWLGIETVELNAAVSRQYGAHSENGLLVSRTFVGSPATVAGITNGDVIRRWNGKIITSQRQFASLMGSASVNQRVKLSIDRQGKQFLTHVQLSLRPGSF